MIETPAMNNNCLGLIFSGAYHSETKKSDCDAHFLSHLPPFQCNDPYMFGRCMKLIAI